MEELFVNSDFRIPRLARRMAGQIKAGVLLQFHEKTPLFLAYSSKLFNLYGFYLFIPINIPFLQRGQGEIIHSHGIPDPERTLWLCLNLYKYS